MLEPFYDLVTNKALTIADEGIERLLSTAKEKEQVYMIGHDGITEHLMTFLIEDRKEVVNRILRTCFANEMQPTIAGEGDKVDARFFYGCMNGHWRKIAKAFVLYKVWPAEKEQWG